MGDMHTRSDAETYTRANAKHRPFLTQSILKHHFVSDSPFRFLKQGVQGCFQHSKARLPHPQGPAETHDPPVSGDVGLNVNPLSSPHHRALTGLPLHPLRHRCRPQHPRFHRSLSGRDPPKQTYTGNPSNHPPRPPNVAVDQAELLSPGVPSVSAAA